MTTWHGKIVASLYRVKGLRDEPVYLIEVDDGDRIWRYESELSHEDPEKERRYNEATQSQARHN